MSEELKPCLFCGGKGEYQEDGPYAWAECLTCGATGTGKTFLFLPAPNDGGRKAVIKNWNTRPIEDALQAEVAALKDAARRIPVTERMPPRNVRVRVWINGTESIARYSWVVPQWVTIDGLYYHGDTLDDVTHWQPLDEDGEG